MELGLSSFAQSLNLARPRLPDLLSNIIILYFIDFVKENNRRKAADYKSKIYRKLFLSGYEYEIGS